MVICATKLTINKPISTARTMCSNQSNASFIKGFSNVIIPPFVSNIPIFLKLYINKFYII